MATIKEIRDLAGISRAEFSRKYNIPVRTLEDWEAGKGSARHTLQTCSIGWYPRTIREIQKMTEIFLSHF